MMSDVLSLDLVEELRLRRWARENYVPAAERAAGWHAVIHDEMDRRDAELSLTPECRRQEFVPLMPGDICCDHPHALRGPNVAPSAASCGHEFYYQ